MAAYELLQEVTGAGGDTCVHTADILQPDKDGSYRTFVENEPVFKGMRTDTGVHYADDGAGTLLDPHPWMVYQPVVTNQINENSRDLSGWSNIAGGSNTYSEIGVSGEANTASKIDDNSTNSYSTETVLPNVVDDHAVTGRILFKKASATTHQVYVNLNFSGGSSGNADAGLFFDAATGVATNRPSYTMDAIEVLDSGDWWTVLFTKARIGDSITTLKMHPAVNSGGTGFDANSQGFQIIGNTEMFLDRTIAEVKRIGLIFSIGAATSTDEIISTFAAANHDDAGTSYEMDVQLTGGDESILLIDGTAILSVVGTNVVLSDGTNTASVPVSADEPHIKITYSGSSMELDVDGVTDTATYDGSFGSGEITTKATIWELERQGY